MENDGSQPKNKTIHHNHFLTSSAKILTVLLALCAIGSIVLLNFQVIEDWFGKQGPSNLGSIEVSYVSMARFITDFGMKTWAPFWYFGFPFHIFYTPLLPFLEALLHQTWKMPLWETYRLLTGIAYIIGPISVFFLGWQLSKRIVGGLIAGLFYSVGPTLFYFFVPGVLAVKNSVSFWDPRRFTILVRWGEGPHLFSLLFVPFVGVFFARALEKPRFLYIFLTAVFLGLTGLTNAIGLFSSVLLLLVMTFVKIAHNKQGKKLYMGFFLSTGLLALGLISFWYNLSFITKFFGEGGSTGNMFLSLFPWGWMAIGVGIGFVYFIIGRFFKNFAIAVSLLWFLIFYIVVYVYYTTQTVELLPQALRYNVEVDLSLALLLGVFVSWVSSFIEEKLKSVFPLLLGVFAILFSFFYIQGFLETAKKATTDVVDLKKTSEYKIALWLNDHIDQKKGERVFLPGNYGFYLNYFSNVWQHRGGLFQASTHHWPDHMHFQMANGTNPGIAKAWLVIANTKYAVVTGPGTHEIYREMKNIERFQGYPVAYDKDGDTIYEVPLKRASLAKPVSLFLMDTLEAPTKGDDKKALFPYADWVENSSKNLASFAVVDNDTYKIAGDVSDGEGILVQMTYDPGWKAVDQQTGKGIPTGKDPLGFLVLYPSNGKVAILLRHTNTLDVWLGYILSATTVGFVLWYGVFGKVKLFSSVSWKT